MKDSIEYLATVVIGCAAGVWLLQQLGGMAMEFLNRIVEMITTAGGHF